MTQEKTDRMLVILMEATGIKTIPWNDRKTYELFSRADTDGVFMIGLFYIGATQAIPNKALFITIYTLSVAFYMPTLALSNTTAFTILKNDGQDTVKAFPSIRVFATIGFIATMWFVNCATFDGETLAITDRAYMLFEGKVLFHGTPEVLSQDPVVKQRYLGRDFELKRKTKVEI